MLQKGDVLRLTKGRVRAANQVNDSSLQRAIHRAIRSGDSFSDHGHTVCLRRGLLTPLSVYVLRMRGSEPLLLDRTTTAMLVVVDPECMPQSSSKQIAFALYLTNAEALLTERLFRGENLRDAAECLNISINTAKSQLKSIYSKTGCSTHAELARKVTIALMVRISSEELVRY